MDEISSGLLALVFCAGGVAGCSVPISHTIDPAFAENTALFERLYNMEVAVGVHFTDEMPDGEFGVCRRFGVNDTRNQVFISRAWWESAGPMARQQLLFHEYGHCVFGLKHVEGVRELGDTPNAPKSIMYPMPFGEFEVYQNNLEFYYDELWREREGDLPD